MSSSSSSVTAVFLEAQPDGSVQVQIHGNLVAGQQLEFRQKVANAIAEHGARRFVLDFTYCPYIDAKGLGELVSVSKAVHDAGGTIALIQLNDDLITLLQLTRVDTLFDEVPTLAGRP